MSGRQALRERDGPHREGEEPKPMMHGHEKSDPAIVAVKPANKAKEAHCGGICGGGRSGVGGAKGGGQGEYAPAQHVRSIRRNIVAGLVCKFLECGNDLSGALRLRRMTAVVNYDKAQVGQITRKAFANPQWNYAILTPPNH